MEKYFANYNQSLILKELGFNEECLYYFNSKGILSTKTDEYELYLIRNDKWISPACSAPLKSQVFEFFRAYGLTAVIEDYLDDYEVKIVEWTLSDDRIVHEFLNRFDSWEEAESACIDKLIEIVKLKK